MCRLLRRRRPNLRRACLPGFKNRFKRTRRIAIRPRILCPSTSMPWIYLTRVFWIERQRGLSRSKMMNTH